MSALTILIVDDQAINLRLLRAQLEGEGQTVLEASNGAEALSVLEREKVDLVISDILMPVMDGYRLCYEVRRSERFRQLPFIIYTASYVSPSDEKLSRDLGADDYLRKPASTADIMRAIRESLARPRREPVAVFESADVLEQYSDRLVAKLEKKNIELIEAVSQLTLRTTALETAADAILITDRDGVILWVNRAFTTNTGYTAEEAIGKTPRILKSGVHSDAFYRAFWESILGGRTWRSEFANRRKDGTIVYDVHTVTPVRGGDGSITHFVGVLHDVTERRLAEEQLRQAHEQLRQVLEHSPAVLYALKVDGETIVPRLVSENITRLLGFEVRETLSWEWWRGQLHSEDRERAEASVAETLERGSSRTEYRMHHKQEGYRWIDDNRRLVRDREGRPAEIVGVWTDVTKRRQVEDELHESERRFQEMLNNLELVAMMLDREGRITYCNDFLLRLTGWTRDEVLGRDWFELFIPPDEVEEMRKVFASLLADSPEMSHHANDILTRSGGKRLLQWNNTLLRSTSGEVIGTASIAEDVTERRRMENQLFRTQRVESLGTLAAGIAHDLNNVLMPILMGVTVVRRLEPDERSRKALDNIERAVTRGRDLARQVMLFVRGGESSREAVRLADVVREVESIANSTFPKDVTFEVSVPDDLRPITGDQTQLIQVLLNLCVNSRDAMPHGGQIAVSASNVEITDQTAVLHGAPAGGPHVLLRVSDTGEGMPTEIIERIFDPFFTTKEIGKGTGLGLATVQGIVSSHGGFIGVSSTLGEGSTFEIYFPARVAGAEAIAEAPAERQPEGKGELILVVDDEASVVSITRQALETFGYQVVSAEDGARAIGIYSRRHAEIALVLTDIAMPVLDGPALIAALSRINPAVRVVAMTGHASTAYSTRMEKLGVDTLVKPFTAEQLLRTIHDALVKNDRRSRGSDPEA
ncbi:MAG TPA: PAS domain S-box protein [Thermoanaerobaculia bacterium]|nr:PAS domain S-box protein [Thermoanaerobaculia bacterium]